MQPCKISRRALYEQVAHLQLWRSPCHIRSFRYPPNVVANTETAELRVHGETVMSATCPPVLLLLPRIHPPFPDNDVVVVTLRLGIQRTSLAIG
jgi:hypothetical protein